MKILTIEDLSNDPVEIVRVPIGKDGVMFIGSLSAEEMIEWQEMRDSGEKEAKRNAPSLLIVRSLVQGPDKHDDGSPLTPEEYKAALVRIGTDDMVKKIRKVKVSATEALLKAISKLNGINQREETATKNV